MHVISELAEFWNSFIFHLLDSIDMNQIICFIMFTDLEILLIMIILKFVIEQT